MKIMSVKQAVYQELMDYLSSNKNIAESELLKSGYVVEIAGKIEASFVLEKLDTGDLWLKQLYITQAKAAKLPVLLESILQIARKREAKIIYVHSHQPVVDILLDALKFRLEKNHEMVSKNPLLSGNWWSYHVS